MQSAKCALEVRWIISPLRISAGAGDTGAGSEPAPYTTTNQVMVTNAHVGVDDVDGLMVCGIFFIYDGESKAANKGQTLKNAQKHTPLHRHSSRNFRL